METNNSSNNYDLLEMASLDGGDALIEYLTGESESSLSNATSKTLSLNDGTTQWYNKWHHVPFSEKASSRNDDNFFIDDEPNSSSQELTAEDKKAIRKTKNRIHAKASRDRKKEKKEKMVNKNKFLIEDNKKKKENINKLKNVLCTLVKVRKDLIHSETCLGCDAIYKCLTPKKKPGLNKVSMEISFRKEQELQPIHPEMGIQLEYLSPITAPSGKVVLCSYKNTTNYNQSSIPTQMLDNENFMPDLVNTNISNSSSSLGAEENGTAKLVTNYKHKVTQTGISFSSKHISSYSSPWCVEAKQEVDKEDNMLKEFLAFK